MTYVTQVDSPLGRLVLASDGQALTGLWFEGQKHFGRIASDALTEENLPVFEQTRAWLCLYFSGKIPGAAPPLKPEGTPFQKTVWEELCLIPYGETVSYGALAKRVAKRLHKECMSAQAVGQAVGRNPISVLVPCHRVLGAGGQLTGYAGGIERKKWLLALEQRGMRPAGQKE